MTLTIELPDELAEQVANVPVEELNRSAVSAISELIQRRGRFNRPSGVSVYIPPSGFARAAREAREAAGDFRPGSQILIEQRRAEGEARDAFLRGERRSAYESNTEATGGYGGYGGDGGDGGDAA